VSEQSAIIIKNNLLMRLIGFFIMVFVKNSYGGFIG